MGYLNKFILKNKKLIDKKLDNLLPKSKLSDSKFFFDKDLAIIHESMRYSLFAGGKRLRAILCMAVFDTFKEKYINSKKELKLFKKNAVLCACAVEVIHTYTLIHDDLPSMDNDDMRRGKPSCHKKYGEAVAILAGDSLNTFAFEILSCMDISLLSNYNLSDFVKELSNSSGSTKLIGGQFLDLDAEKTIIDNNKNNKKELYIKLQKIHKKKTASLISCSLKLGAMCADVNKKNLKKISKIGLNLGQAFQVIDDILDVTQTDEHLGKTAGKDIKSNKMTYPSLIGLKKSKKIATKLTNSAINRIQKISLDHKQTNKKSVNSSIIIQIAKYMLARTN